MFSRRVFGGSADVFKISLEFGRSLDDPTSLSAVRLPKAVATLDLEWNSDEATEAVLERFTQRKSALILDQHLEERLVLELVPKAGRCDAIVTRLLVRASYPALRCINVSRVNGSGSVSEPLLAGLLRHMSLEGARHSATRVVHAACTAACTAGAYGQHARAGLRTMNTASQAWSTKHAGWACHLQIVLWSSCTVHA